MRPSGEPFCARPMAFGVLILASLLGEAGAQSGSRIVQVRGGETLRVTAPDGPNFSLRFVSVISDERCPARVRCAWANPPVIALEASAPGEATRTFEIGLGGPGGARQGRYLGASIEYVDMLPAPQEIGEFSKRKPLAAYTAVLNIGGPEKKR